jgi:hypothetical protein
MPGDGSTEPEHGASITFANAAGTPFNRTFWPTDSILVALNVAAAHRAT